MLGTSGPDWTQRDDKHTLLFKNLKNIIQSEETLGLKDYAYSTCIHGEIIKMSHGSSCDAHDIEVTMYIHSFAKNPGTNVTGNWCRSAVEILAWIYFR